VTVQDRIEELRGTLAERAPPGFCVTAKRTQYAMDEDTEAFCEIAVTGGGDEFRLVVVATHELQELEQLMRRVWLRYARELWLVSEEGIRRATPESPEPIHVADIEIAMIQMYLISHSGAVG
jgi:hypothetical protein